MKKISKISISIVFLMQLIFSAFANKNDSLTVNKNYTEAFGAINNMLTHSSALNFEDAIFTIENAYQDNGLNKQEYNNSLNFHSRRILLLAESNADKITQLISENNNPSGIEIKPSGERKKMADNLLLNWAIYTYLTDTTWWKDGENYVAHYPVQYDTSDPYGNNNWENTMVANLLFKERSKGNCFSLAVLYYIFSQRLQTDAFLSTAPNHIYIQHKGMDETYYNVELTTHSFPGSGTIKTYTYTSHKAISNGIAMKRLTEKEAVALCAVYLVKGYEKKVRIKNEELRMENFELSCSELALSFDSLCLSAMLLKQQILAENKINADELLSSMKKLQENGYEQMPDKMQVSIVAEIQNKKETVKVYVSSPFEEINKSRSYYSLSKNKYPEIKTSSNNLYAVGNICLNSAAQEIQYIFDTNLAMLETYDPVVFALSIDPLAEKYPTLSPYNFCANNPIIFVDPDGKQIAVSGSLKYKEQYALSRERILAAGGQGADKLRDLEKSQKVVTVKEIHDMTDSYDGANTVSWDPNSALEVVDDSGNKTGGKQSSAAGLSHELSHAWDNLIDNNYDTQKIPKGDPLEHFENMTDYNAITGSEFGYVEHYGEGKRFNHYGKGYHSSSPVSTRRGKESLEDKVARHQAYGRYFVLGEGAPRSRKQDGDISFVGEASSHTTFEEDRNGPAVKMDDIPLPSQDSRSISSEPIPWEKYEGR